jgi:hypothetical protein
MGTDETRSTTDVTAFIQAIDGDVEIAQKCLKEQDSPYNRRAFVKNYYSFLEGLLHFLRAEVIRTVAIEPGRLTEAKIAVLKEETYEVTGSGKIQTREKFLSFEHAFRLSIHYYFTSVINQVTVDYGGKGWHALRQGLRIRNRITHPKATAQMEISDEELAIVRVAKEWTDATITALFQAHIKRHRQEAEHILAESEKLREQAAENIRKTEEVNKILRDFQDYAIKYPVVIDVGWLGDNNGVELRLPRYFMWEGKRIPVVYSNESVPAEVAFPMRFFDSLTQQ